MGGGEGLTATLEAQVRDRWEEQQGATENEEQETADTGLVFG